MLLAQMITKEQFRGQPQEISQSNHLHEENYQDPRILFRDQLREELAALASIITKRDVRYWWPLTVRYLMKLRDKLDSFPPEIKEYLALRYNIFVDYVLAEIDVEPVGEKRRSQIIQRVDSLIMVFSEEMARGYWTEHEEIKANFIPLRELVKSYPQHFTLRRAKVVRAGEELDTCWKEVDVDASDYSENGEDVYDFIFMGIRHPEKGVINELPMPIGEHIYHKGGPARLVLNLIQGAPIEMIRADYLWNDLDIIAFGDENSRVRQIADVMGVDPEGVETFQQQELDTNWYFYGRDTTQNQVTLGAEGIYFSDAAAQVARTGKSKTVGLYVPNKALYGEDVAIFKGHEFIKARGLMRLIKAVAERKLISFEYMPINSELDFGVYWLFLARKWSSRREFGELMQRMYELGRKTGQVRGGEEDIFAVLDRVHTMYPFFDLDMELTSMLDVVRWKASKLAKQMDREFRWEYQVPSQLDLYPDEENTIPREINLNNFVADPEYSEYVREEWRNFLARCRVRTEGFKQLQLSYVDELFMVSDIKRWGHFFELDD